MAQKHGKGLIMDLQLIEARYAHTEEKESFWNLACTHILPGIEDKREPRRRIQDRPVNNQNQKGICRYAGVVQAMEASKESR
jgi:hypothetical protein